MIEMIETVSDFNEFGGGPPEEEDECFDYLHDIIDILEESEVPREIRREIIDDFMEEYLVYNSGFVDMLREVVFSAAKDKDDWELVIDKLNDSDSKFDQGDIMWIYLNIFNDDQKYLELRKKHLEYGMDYYNLALYFWDKGEKDKAAEVALEGAEKGKGRTFDNLKLLKNYYLEKGDYNRAREFYFKEFEANPSMELYEEIKKLYDKTEEVTKAKQNLLNSLEQKNNLINSHVLAKIYYYEGYNERLLDLITNNKITPSSEYESVLEEKFPERMIEYYSIHVQRKISQKERKAYREGAQIAKKIKRIYVEHLKRPEEWDRYINKILQNYPRHKALQEEFKNVV